MGLSRRMPQKCVPTDSNAYASNSDINDGDAWHSHTNDGSMCLPFAAYPCP